MPDHDAPIPRGGVPRDAHRGVHVDRRIAADPASAALLCAGPAVAELWPGVTRGDGDQLRLARRRQAARVLSLRTTAPRRTPTSYLCSFEVDELHDVDAGTPGRVVGWLELAYEEGDGGRPATRARLVVDAVGLAPAGAREVTRDAERFLANLAGAAERRAHAA